MKKCGFLIAALLLAGCVYYTDKPPIYAGVDITGRPQFLPVPENQPIDYNPVALQQNLITTDQESERFKSYLIKSQSNRQDIINALIESEQANRRLYKIIVNL